MKVKNIKKKTTKYNNIIKMNLKSIAEVNSLKVVLSKLFEIIKVKIKENKINPKENKTALIIFDKLSLLCKIYFYMHFL